MPMEDRIYETIVEGESSVSKDVFSVTKVKINEQTETNINNRLNRTDGWR